MLATPEIIDPDYEKIYEPAEDSYLLLDLFEELETYFKSKQFAHKTPLVVEIGTGTGIVTTFLNKYILPNSIYIATDLNPYCCETLIRTNKFNATEQNLDSIRCDLTTCLNTNSIDVLVFNPPYVPAEKIPEIPETEEEENNWVDIALNGGPEGMDVTIKVLNRLNHILAVEGEAYILFCARNKPEVIADQFKVKNPNFKVERMIHRKAGWEELSIYRFHKLD